LILANAGVFLFQLTLPEQQLERLVYLFGVVPRRFVHPDWAMWAGFPADDYWPFLTSMFLHGGWFHIFSNMWALWIFGDNVEDRMGSIRFSVFYLVCGLAAGVVHLVTNPTSPVPAIGASGAIAGVLAAYFVLYPFARLICMVPVFIFPLFIELPAFLFILVWLVSQLHSGTLSLLEPGRGGGIAWWAHIGGFLAGIALHRLFLARRRARGRLLPRI
jgi:membrane associated rhomboid family serine protease